MLTVYSCNIINLFVAYLRGIETREILPSGCISLYPFVAYLRGIETRRSVSNIRHKARFVAYLRGIETKSTEALGEVLLHVCSLPTRD